MPAVALDLIISHSARPCTCLSARDVDGPLGTGEEACLSEGALSLGPHRLTLTATDSDGQSAQATVEAQVGGAVVGEHVLYLPALER